MAVDLASGVVSNDGHLLTSARIHGAYLGLVAVEPTSEWALVAVVSEVDGTYVPMTLGTMVSTRRPELIVRGAAWWPGRGSPRWLWLVGRVHSASGRALPQSRIKGQLTAEPVSASGWFAHLARADTGQESLAVEVSRGSGWVAA